MVASENPHEQSIAALIQKFNTKAQKISTSINKESDRPAYNPYTPEFFEAVGSPNSRRHSLAASSYGPGRLKSGAYIIHNSGCGSDVVADERSRFLPVQSSQEEPPCSSTGAEVKEEEDVLLNRSRSVDALPPLSPPQHEGPIVENFDEAAQEVEVVPPPQECPAEAATIEPSSSDNIHQTSPLAEQQKSSVAAYFNPPATTTSTRPIPRIIDVPKESVWQASEERTLKNPYSSFFNRWTQQAQQPAPVQEQPPQRPQAPPKKEEINIDSTPPKEETRNKAFENNKNFPAATRSPIKSTAPATRRLSHSSLSSGSSCDSSSTASPDARPASSTKPIPTTRAQAVGAKMTTTEAPVLDTGDSATVPSQPEPAAATGTTNIPSQPKLVLEGRMSNATSDGDTDSVVAKNTRANEVIHLVDPDQLFSANAASGSKGGKDDSDDDDDWDPSDFHGNGRGGGGRSQQKARSSIKVLNAAEDQSKSLGANFLGLSPSNMNRRSSMKRSSLAKFRLNEDDDAATLPKMDFQAKVARRVSFSPDHAIDEVRNYEVTSNECSTDRDRSHVSDDTISSDEEPELEQEDTLIMSGSTMNSTPNNNHKSNKPVRDWSDGDDGIDEEYSSDSSVEDSTGNSRGTSGQSKKTGTQNHASSKDASSKDDEAADNTASASNNSKNSAPNNEKSKSSNKSSGERSKSSQGGKRGSSSRRSSGRGTSSRRDKKKSSGGKAPQEEQSAGDVNKNSEALDTDLLLSPMTPEEEGADNLNFDSVSEAGTDCSDTSIICDATSLLLNSGNPALSALANPGLPSGGPQYDNDKDFPRRSPQSQASRDNQFYDEEGYNYYADNDDNDQDGRYESDDHLLPRHNNKFSRSRSARRGPKRDEDDEDETTNKSSCSCCCAIWILIAVLAVFLLGGGFWVVLAAVSGQLSVVKDWFGCGAVNTDELFAMAAEGNLAELRKVMNQKGAEFLCDARKTNKETLIFVAAEAGHVETLRFLVNEAKCDPEIPNENNVTPFQRVVEFQMQPNPPNNNTLNNLMRAKRFLMTKKQMTPKIPSETVRAEIRDASREGTMEVLQKYLAEGYDICVEQDSRNYPLHLAVMREQYKVVQYLVEHAKCNLLVKNRDGFTPAKLAQECARTQEKKKIDIENYLRNQTLEVMKEITDTIDMAARGDILGLIRKQFAGKSLSRGDYDDRTPLHLAVSNAQLETVKFLVLHGDHPLQSKDRFDILPTAQGLCERNIDPIHVRFSEDAPLPKAVAPKNLINGKAPTQALQACFKIGQFLKRVAVEGGLQKELKSVDRDIFDVGLRGRWVAFSEEEDEEDGKLTLEFVAAAQFDDWRGMKLIEDNVKDKITKKIKKANEGLSGQGLEEAVKNNMKAWVKKGDYDNRNPLHIAVEERSFAAVDYLLKAYERYGGIQEDFIAVKDRFGKDALKLAQAMVDKLPNRPELADDFKNAGIGVV